MAAPRYRAFFDTSVYIAALLSSEGASGELIRLVESGAIRMVVSEEVVVEIDRVLSSKFPVRVQRSRELLKRLTPEVALDESDASILCSAHLAKVSMFVTWNTRDFMAHGVDVLVDFPIVIPANALKLFRKWIEPFLD